MKVPKKITLQGFIDWIRINTKCEVRITGQDRVNVVVFADNIEPGKCVPLYARVSGDKVMIRELSDDYHSVEEAWQALEDAGANSYATQPFQDWVQDQYLTAKDVRVEKLSF